MLNKYPRIQGPLATLLLLPALFAYRPGGGPRRRAACRNPSPTPVPRSEDSAIPVSMDGHRLIHTNGTLLLRAVKAEDSGYYTCTATNTGGFDTIIVNLLVQGETPRGRWGSGESGGQERRRGRNCIM